MQRISKLYPANARFADLASFGAPPAHSTSGNGIPKPLRNVKKAIAKQAAQRWKTKNQLFALLGLGGT